MGTVCLSWVIGTAGQDTASWLVLSSVPPFLQFLLLSQHGACKHATTLSRTQAHDPLQTLSIAATMMVCVMRHKVMVQSVCEMCEDEGIGGTSPSTA